jgi:hypothetical protein
MSSNSSPFKAIRPSGSRDALSGLATQGSGELPTMPPMVVDIDSDKIKRCPVRLASRAVLSHLVRLAWTNGVFV